jgi:hypothetical protein
MWVPIAMAWPVLRLQIEEVSSRDERYLRVYCLSSCNSCQGVVLQVGGWWGVNRSSL